MPPIPTRPRPVLIGALFALAVSVGLNAWLAYALLDNAVTLSYSDDSIRYAQETCENAVALADRLAGKLPYQTVRSTMIDLHGKPPIPTDKEILGGRLRVTPSGAGAKVESSDCG